MDVQERFWSKMIPEPMSGCWLWIGPLYRNGYGHFGVKRKGKTHNHLAHRLAYKLHHGGTLAPTEVLRHSCDTPACVNPEHLYLGTQWDNIQDCLRRGRFRSGSHNSFKTECRRGHPFTPDNTGYNVRGERVCKTCNRARARASYYRLQGRQPCSMDRT